MTTFHPLTTTTATSAALASPSGRPVPPPSRQRPAEGEHRAEGYQTQGAEYLIHAVAAGVEDYYMGIGEAPGIWRGSWAAELGLEGAVSADDLGAGRGP
ncbi:MAG TPA: relaxase domain-containing protein [Acidimicrobiales bacterium]|nr:relaxase domain-containing protein [Acidimicrobiales bacterium]